VRYGRDPRDSGCSFSRGDEDAAHALPSKYKGKFVGTISDLTAFSFYATKTLATGEGGMITTPREDFAEKIRLMRLHEFPAMRGAFTNEGTWKYDVLDAGFKYNITDVASSIGLAQLSKIDMMNDMRMRSRIVYNESFSSIDGIFRTSCGRTANHAIIYIRSASISRRLCAPAMNLTMS
jgi:dTDP-4-amino-4,6-dideoxygalactose transaminase